MAEYDARKSWFPEMLDELKRFWSSKTSWEEAIVFCRRMTEYRTKIEKAKRIKPLRIHCKGCGESIPRPPISVRSCLFTLLKINVIDDKEFVRLDQEWKKYGRKNRLDGYGNKRK